MLLKLALKPLSKILDIYLNNNDIDFLNIDAEGSDLDVLKNQMIGQNTVQNLFWLKF